MQEKLREAIKAVCSKLFNLEVEVDLSRPDAKFGDFATNVALQLAPRLHKNPPAVAAELLPELNKLDGVAKAETAGPGFTNLTLTDEALADGLSLATHLPKPLAGQQILVEFGDPNPFKEMHIGHLYSYIVGDSICRFLEAQGADVKRLSYHGDVGRHVAMAIYGLGQIAGNGEDNEDFLGQAYALGNQKYETEPQAQAEVETINQHIYAQDDPEINQLHQKGIDLSFKHFNKILDLLSISTDKRYLESQTTPIGLQLVRDNIGQIFVKSQGAVVFEGERAGLHTRVFITSKNLPTYETKDLGLVQLKNSDFPEAKRSIVITANEQAEYFKVMLAALAEINQELAAKTTHMSHGFVNLSTGKMSSRSGQVYPAMQLLMDVKDAVQAQYPDSPVRKPITIAAIKYAFLKHRLGQDLTYDVKESISLEGSSGPYLQYAHARAASIIQKSKDQTSNPKPENFDEQERSLASKISEYPEVISRAGAELMPHHVTNYLYELAQCFNRFYESSRIIGSERTATRLQLVKAYKDVLNHGLNLMGIDAPERI